MATTNDPRTKPTRSKRARLLPRRDGIFRYTLEQVYQLADLGYFDDRRVELIGGVLYEMTAYPPHEISSMMIVAVLQKIFGVGWLIREAHTLDLGPRSLLEPDIAVVRGSFADFSKKFPTSADLIIEVSDSTLRKDRKIKGPIYAKAGLPDYWIVNLVDRHLEVYRNPQPDPAKPGRFSYADVTIVLETGSMAPLSAPQSLIAVADLLPELPSPSPSPL